MAQAAIPIAVMAASQLYSGFTEMQGLNAGAKANRENARRAEMEGEYQALDVAQRERAVSGAAIAALGASGARVGTGSAADLIRQNAINREADILAVRYRAQSEADALRAQARQQKKAGRYALIGGVLRAGAAAVSEYRDYKRDEAMAEAADRRRRAELPGGQQLPMPRSLGY